MKTIYIIDANALIDASKYYNMKKSTFASIWTAIEELISQGELISSSEIFDELKDDDLLAWAKLHKEMFIPLSKEIQEHTVDILGKYPTMIKIKSSSNSNGDPFLVATAIQYSGCVITNERLGDEKSGDFHIPNVCNGYNIPYMDLNTFLDHILK